MNLDDIADEIGQIIDKDAENSLVQITDGEEGIDYMIFGKSAYFAFFNRRTKKVIKDFVRDKRAEKLRRILK